MRHRRVSAHSRRNMMHLVRMSLAEMMKSMLRAKMSDSCLEFEGGRATLFTEQRALTQFWCVALLVAASLEACVRAFLDKVRFKLWRTG